MIDKTIFEVSREQYAYYCKTIRPEVKDITTVEDQTTFSTQIWRRGRRGPDDLMAERVSYIDGSPERYYIYMLPTQEEAIEPKITPTRKVILETPQQVKKVLDYIREQKQKGANNDGAI